VLRYLKVMIDERRLKRNPLRIHFASSRNVFR
jgi:hypothetical protein